MENQVNHPSGNKRTPWIIGVAVVAIAVIGYFSFFYPPVSQDEVSGTIGGVQKAEKYRAPQLTDNDMVIKNAEVQKFLQTDRFDKLSKDATFKAALSKSEVQAWLSNANVQAM
ncbi:MAG: hypothetical protein HW389_3100, partial [Bacteroidetes bacterium]|nr:hypothetical protein [Bacteroidota bacterium]